MSKKSTKKSNKRQRLERRFLPQSSTNPWLVRVPGALGSAGVGAGVWGHLYGHFVPAEGAGTQYNIPLFVLAGGAVLLAGAIWLGTSSDAAIRVGDPGVAYEKGEPRRIPWWKMKSITFEAGTESLVLSGKDEQDLDFVFRVSARSQPQAAAWIVREALVRIPKKIDVKDAIIDRLPEPSEHAGTTLLLEGLQVVGRRCAASKKLIAYEPDARVCGACERVYHKDKVPSKCPCGADLAALRGGKPAADPEPVEAPHDGDDEDEDDDEAEAGSDGKVRAEA